MTEATPARLCVRAPAKINLSLQVLRRRPDGYHEIRTVMQAVSLFDRLEFTLRPDGDVRLTCDRPDVPTGDGNLIVRAARLLQERHRVEAGVDVTLHKVIPMGGGLGGGSSDAAVTLLALNRMWGLGARPEDLVDVAAGLGSDVPFFLWGGTAVCEGRGERVRPVACEGARWYVLIMPDLSVSTRAVYDALKAPLTGRGDGSNNVPAALRPGEGPDCGLRNDLQEPSFSVCEDLRELADGLAEFSPALGGQGVLLSGSGSSFFIVMPGSTEAERAVEALSVLGAACVAVHSLPSWDGDIALLTSRRRHL